MSQDDQVYKEVEDKIIDVQSDLSATFKRWNELEDLYFFHTPANKKSTKSNIFDPMAFEQVEHTVSHLYAQPPRGEYIPMEPNDNINVEVMNEIKKYQWNLPDANMHKKLINMLRRMTMYGTAYSVMHWRYERRFNKLLNKFEQVWDAPCLYDLNGYDSYPDLDASSWEDMQFFAHDEFVSFETLEAQNQGKEKRYKNLDKLKELIGDGDKGATIDNSYRNNLLVRRKINKAEEQQGRVKVTRMYYPDRWVSIVRDYKLVIEDRPNPYWHGKLPVIPLVDVDIPGVILGIGEIDPVRTLMTAMNQAINMRFDNIKMILEKPMIAKKSALEHMKTWTWGRNSVMIVNQDGDLKPMDIPDTTGATFVQTLNMLTDTIRSRMGRTDILTSNRGNKTATEVDAMAAEQNSRLNYKLQNFEKYIRDVSVMMMQLNQQFLTKERFIRIVGADNLTKLEKTFANDPERLKISARDVGFLKIKPEDIKGAFDYMVESGSTKIANDRKEIENNIQVLDLLAKTKDEFTQRGMELDLTPIVTNTITKLGIKNIDSVIKKIQNEPTAGIGQPDIQGPSQTAGVPGGNQLPQQPLPTVPQQPTGLPVGGGNAIAGQVGNVGGNFGIF